MRAAALKPAISSLLDSKHGVDIPDEDKEPTPKAVTTARDVD